MLYLIFVVITFILLSVSINIYSEHYNNLDISLDLNQSNGEGYVGYLFVLLLSLVFPMVYLIGFSALFIVLIAKGMDKLFKYIISKIESTNWVTDWLANFIKSKL